VNKQVKKLFHFVDAAKCGHYFVGVDAEMAKVRWARDVRVVSQGALQGATFQTARHGRWLVRSCGTAVKG